MTDTISKAAKAKALELSNAISVEWGHGPDIRDMSDLQPEQDAALIALARVLQEHSDIVKDAQDDLRKAYGDVVAEHVDTLQSMILPDDEPDPLGDAWNARWPSSTENLELLRADLDAAGYEIRRKDG